MKFFRLWLAATAIGLGMLLFVALT